MDRIAIVGCSGGGKSTLARALGERLGLPVIHIDTLYWKPGWVESANEEILAAVDEVAGRDRWITDGNFRRASGRRFARADLIVWVDQPAALCLWRAFWRAVTQFGHPRADLAPGCPERIDLNFYIYILNWNRATRPRIEEDLRKYAPDTPVVRLRGDRAIAAWLARLGDSVRLLE